MLEDSGKSLLADLLTKKLSTSVSHLRFEGLPSMACDQTRKMASGLRASVLESSRFRDHFSGFYGEWSTWLSHVLTI